MTELVTLSTDKKLIFHRVINIHSELLEKLVRAIRQISIQVAEVDSDLSKAISLEALRLGLTLVLPEEDFASRVGLGKDERIRRIWGQEIADLCLFVESSIKCIRLSPHKPMDFFLDQIESLTDDCKQTEKIKIYCHRSEVNLIRRYCSELGIELSTESFITTKTEYLNCSNFDTLVLIRPIRSYGWAKLPAILITAPVFNNLIQIKFDFIDNDMQIADDPILPDVNYHELAYRVELEPRILNYPKIDKLSLQFDESSLEELFNFESSRPFKNDSECIAFICDREQEILYSLGSRLVTFDNAFQTPVLGEKKAYQVHAGEFLVIQQLSAETSTASIDAFKLAPLWKAQLAKELNWSYESLISKCRMAGIQLKSLDAALKHWSSQKDTVLHAPQSQEHFKALIQHVLPSGTLGGGTWEHAWAEIRSYRGKAIQDGRDLNESLRHEIIEALKDEIDCIMSLAKYQDHFEVNLDSDWGGAGVLIFSKVRSISTGYISPREKQGILLDPGSIDLFRTE